MDSYNYGKNEVVEWAKKSFPQYSSCLDVGACNGKWHSLLGDYFIMDAVEIYTPNITTHNLKKKYRKVFNLDICDLEYQWYDLIIFGDVIEHLTVPDAQRVIEYAWGRCKDMVVAVPYLFKQDGAYGNPWERHIQDDLTPRIFDERYKGFTQLWANKYYGYYHKTTEHTIGR